MAAQEGSVREVEALMAEGFGGPQPNPQSPKNEVTVAVNREIQAEVPVGVPFQPLMPEPLGSDFSF